MTARSAPEPAAPRAAPATHAPYLERGTAPFVRANVALFLAGLVVFAILYCTQPLLPVYASTFQLSPATASFSLSIATGTLALALVPAGSLSEAWGRTRIMACSLAATAVLQVLLAWAPGFEVLLVVRALQGLAIAGLLASAIAYLGEEVHPNALGFATGLYISGNSIGGLLGRILVGTLADVFSWRVALGAVGVMSLLVALAFWRLVPPSAHFRARPATLHSLVPSVVRHLRDPILRRLFVLAALVMGSFVIAYNYLSFRLLAPPYRLSPGQISWVFAMYLVGTFSSTWMGRMADRFGRRGLVLVNLLVMAAGAGITLARPLPAVLLGLAALTFGFFAAHSMASSWVAARASSARAQASALYLFAYYLGSSVGGSVGGLAYVHAQWPGVVVMIGALVGIALLVTLGLPAAVEPAGQDTTNSSTTRLR